MAKDLNKTILIGRTTKDPEPKFTPQGTPVASFSLANNDSYKNASGEIVDNTSFFNCFVMGKSAETFMQYVKKGNKICVEGRLQQRSWDDQNGNKRSVVEVKVENYYFLTPKGEGAPVSRMNNNPFSDDEIPM